MKAINLKVYIEQNLMNGAVLKIKKRFFFLLTAQFSAIQNLE